MPTRRFILASAIACSLAPTRAQSWPSQPIRLVVPFVPGGSTDVLARQLAEKLRPALGQPVVVENRGGAGGTIGSDSVAKAAPDGHTLLMGVTGTHGIAPSIYPNLPYHPRRDFAPISRLVAAPLVILVRPDAGLDTIGAYIAAARAGTVTYGTPGTGTSMHLCGVQFALAAGAPLTHVPYRGSAPAFADLLGGRITSLVGDILIALPHIQAGTLKVIAVTSPGRNPLLPDVPSVQESGLAGFSALSWQGLFAPAYTPAAIIARLYREVKAVMEAPEVTRFFAAQGFDVRPTAPDEFGLFVEAEIDRWAGIVRAGNVKVE